VRESKFSKKIAMESAAVRPKKIDIFAA